MKSSGEEFKDAIDKAYTRQPNVKLNSTTMGDALKFKSDFTEEVDGDGNKYETFLQKRKRINIKLQTLTSPSNKNWLLP